MAYSDLQKYSHNETNRKIDQVRRAIEDLQTTGDPLNVSSVARHAGVSKSFIHRHAEVKQWIRHAPAISNGMSNQSQSKYMALSAENSTLRSQSVRQNEKIKHLESRLSKYIGQSMTSDEAILAPDAMAPLQERIMELEKVNERLARDKDVLEEELRAVRIANRKLMKQLSHQYD